MSSIKEARVEIGHVSVCAAETGHVYIVAPERTSALMETDAVVDHVSDADTCDTFQHVAPPEHCDTLVHAVTACLKGNLYHLGGTSSVEGPQFGYIWCSYDLQEFHTRYTERYPYDRNGNIHDIRQY